MEEINKTGEQGIKEIPHDPKDYAEKINKSGDETKTIIFFIGFVIVIGIGVVAYFFWTEIKQKLSFGKGGEACQMDAKVCPDGTTLSRTLPGCQFPVCPGSKNGLDITYWQEYTSEVLGAIFKYPPDWAIKTEEMGLLEIADSKDGKRKIMMLKTSASAPEEVDMNLQEKSEIDAGGYAAQKELFKNKKDDDKYYLRVFIKDRGIIISVDMDKENLAELSEIFDNVIFSIRFSGQGEEEAADLKVDTDSDGLYDFEEAEYKTDPAKADTDGDGYNDGDEVKNFYNPAGEGKLAENWNTPAGAIAAFEAARANCQGSLFEEKVYFAEDFYQPIIDMAIKEIGRQGASSQEINLEMEDFYKELEENKEELKDSFFSEVLWDKIYTNKIASLQLSGKKAADKNNIAYRYKISYSEDARGYAPDSEEKTIYLTKINNEWQLDFKNQIKFAAEKERATQKTELGVVAPEMPTTNKTKILTPEYINCRWNRNEVGIPDIMQIQTALELYFNDHNTYPATVNFGGSIKGEESAGGVVYMEKVPNPTLTSDLCKGYENYSYTQEKDGAEYELVYCLEKDIGGIKAGPHTASPSGIQ